MLVVRNPQTGYEAHAFEVSADAYKSVLARLKRRGAEQIFSNSLKVGRVSFFYVVSPRNKEGTEKS